MKDLNVINKKLKGVQKLKGSSLEASTLLELICSNIGDEQETDVMHLARTIYNNSRNTDKEEAVNFLNEYQTGVNRLAYRISLIFDMMQEDGIVHVASDDKTFVWHIDGGYSPRHTFKALVDGTSLCDFEFEELQSESGFKVVKFNVGDEQVVITYSSALNRKQWNKLSELMEMQCA